MEIYLNDVKTFLLIYRSLFELFSVNSFWADSMCKPSVFSHVDGSYHFFRGFSSLALS